MNPLLELYGLRAYNELLRLRNNFKFWKLNRAARKLGIEFYWIGNDLSVRHLKQPEHNNER